MFVGFVVFNRGVSFLSIALLEWISPQLVRRHCADGNLKATQTLQGSGKWRVETDQLMNQPNWEKYLQKRARIKLKSHNLADKMIDYLDDDEIE